MGDRRALRQEGLLRAVFAVEVAAKEWLDLLSMRGSISVFHGLHGPFSSDPAQYKILFLQLVSSRS